MKTLKLLDLIEEYAAGILFLGASALILYEVFMRYVMNSPQFGINEIVGVLLPWAVFIAFGRALKQNHHIAVDIVYDKLPFAVKRVFAVLSNLFGAGFTVFLFITGIQMVMKSKSDGFKTVALEFPEWIPYIILPVSMFLFSIYFINKTYKAIIGDKQEIIGGHEQDIAHVDDEDGGMSS